jgi:methyl-accepting chemotaxis protein
MAQHWSFGRKLAAGFGVAVAFTAINGLLSVMAMRDVVDAKDRVIDGETRALVGAATLETAVEQHVSALRGYLLTAESRYADELVVAQTRFLDVIRGLKAELPSDVAELSVIEASHVEYARSAQQLMEMRSKGDSSESIENAFVTTLRPKRQALGQLATSFVDHQTELLQAAKQSASDAAERTNRWVGLIAVMAALFSGLTAVILGRGLGQQIGSAVGHVQSSSAELQAAANQQATGAREQATAMTEITTTISELLTTSRQIAESARRVVAMADQTASAGRAGETTVGKAHEAISLIQRQVEQIVTHMLDLGKKTQQIGVVLDIVSELAEQTNILAINATIEAIGAGDSGKRFAVVADEIRRLADRVSASTKEIRGLIEEVRSAANTTVMATETGSKTVDAGSRHFGEVSSAFRQIASLVDTTTEAAREIELSTKQQSSAVEQVNMAVANVAQATRESETSSTQTLQTASQLASLSKDLLRVVRPQQISS